MNQPQFKTPFALSLFLILLVWHAHSSEFQQKLEIEGTRYASDLSAVQNFRSVSHFQNLHFNGKIVGFFQTGSKGNFSIDPDPLMYSQTLGKRIRFWAGREYPFLGERPSPFSSLGAIASQNATEALEPRVSGWVGTGGVMQVNSKTLFKFAFSPIFLPTFGPSLGINERGSDLAPTRFSRLPPEQVDTGNATIPIRYRLRIDQMKELVLQNQYFLSMDLHFSENHHIEPFFWSAPRPNPVASTESYLSVDPEKINATVNVTPAFPRQNFFGFRHRVKWMNHFNLENQFLIQTRGHSRILYSSELTHSYFSIGFSSQSRSEDSSPSAQDHFLFLGAKTELSRRISYQTRIQTTLKTSKESLAWMSDLALRFTQNLSGILRLGILSGADSSYFGDWRQEDYFSLGVQWII